MNNKIVKLYNQCKNLDKEPHYIDMCNEIIELVFNGNYEEKIKINLLIELYRYLFYSPSITSIDPRGDSKLKFFILCEIKRGLSSNSISEELIDKLRKANDCMRKNIDNPMLIIESRIRFFNEHPGAKF